MFTIKSGMNISKSIQQFYVPKRGKRVWPRKPIGGPPAPSKQFRIPVKPIVPQDEQAEHKRLLNNYRSQMKALQYDREHINFKILDYSRILCI